MTDSHTYASLIGGSFAIWSILISLNLVYKHSRNYTNPNHQRYIIRILWMVPIYALDSFLSILFKDYQFYFDVLRDCYEAYVLYMFFTLLVKYLGESSLEYILEQKPPKKHPVPLCCLPRFSPGGSFYKWCKFSIWQFAILKPLLAILALILEVNGHYEAGTFSPTAPYFWVTVFYNISIAIAMYFLVLFYTVTKEELAPYNPVPKFLCIKAVIFFSFWQGVGISILTYIGAIHDVGSWSAENIAIALQDLIICIEMFFISIAHIYVFPYSPYQREDKRPFIRSILKGKTDEMRKMKTSMFDVYHPKHDLMDSLETLSPAKKVVEKIPLIPLYRTTELPESEN